MALFGPSDGGSREPRSLVEFRAGKMTLKEATHMVVPDKRKGLIFMKVDNEGLLHFYWKDRQHGRTEDVQLCPYSTIVLIFSFRTSPFFQKKLR